MRVAITNELMHINIQKSNQRKALKSQSKQSKSEMNLILKFSWTISGNVISALEWSEPVESEQIKKAGAHDDGFVYLTYSKAN